METGIIPNAAAASAAELRMDVVIYQGMYTSTFVPRAILFVYIRTRITKKKKRGEKSLRKFQSIHDI